MSRRTCVYCSRKRGQYFMFNVWIPLINDSKWFCRDHLHDKSLIVSNRRESSAVDAVPGGIQYSLSISFKH